MGLAGVFAEAERVRYAVATGGAASWALGSTSPPLAGPRESDGAGSAWSWRARPSGAVSANGSKCCAFATFSDAGCDSHDFWPTKNPQKVPEEANWQENGLRRKPLRIQMHRLENLTL